MANYTKLTNFASKDALASGNPLKIVKGTEIDDEFEALETAVATKADSASPTFTGTPASVTPTVSDDSTKIATTAFVKDAISSGGYVATAGIADNAITLAKMADDSVGAAELVDNSVGADALNVLGDGASGQALLSDGDGTMSWGTIQSKILNTYQATKTGTQSIYNNSFQDISGLSITLTPTSSSSKFLLMAHVSLMAADDGGLLRFSGGNSGTAIGDAAGSRPRVYSAGGRFLSGDIDSRSVTMVYIDSPATTSSTTYKVQCRSDLNDYTHINRSYIDPNDSDRGFRAFSVLTIMEIDS